MITEILFGSKQFHASASIMYQLHPGMAKNLDKMEHQLSRDYFSKGFTSRYVE